MNLNTIALVIGYIVVIGIMLSATYIAAAIIYCYFRETIRFFLLIRKVDKVHGRDHNVWTWKFFKYVFWKMAFDLTTITKSETWRNKYFIFSSDRAEVLRKRTK